MQQEAPMNQEILVVVETVRVSVIFTYWGQRLFQNNR